MGRFVETEIRHDGRPPAADDAVVGRGAEVDALVGWIGSGTPGTYVVTGSAGTGTSSIVARAASLSEPAVVPIAARGRTADQLAGLLDTRLRGDGVLPPQDEERTAADLVGALSRAGTVPVIVVDGLDEARGEAPAIAHDLLARVGRWACVVVATRPVPVPGPVPGTLVDAVAPTAVLDLDDPVAREAGREALAAFVRLRLTGVPGADLVADHLARSTGADDRPFLLARMVTDQLRDRPVDTAEPGWERRLPGSVGEALEGDLARVAAPVHRDLPDPPAVARALLTALTWSFGAGFPEAEWRAVAGVLTGLEVGADDIAWVLAELGHLVASDDEAGVVVHRMAHQSLAEHLRPPYRASADAMVDPAAEPVAAALLDRYAALLADDHGATGPTYLGRYAWRHAAAAGAPGVRRFRDLARATPGLRPDAARAGLEIARRPAFWGDPAGAIPDAEDAVARWRELAVERPALRRDLAPALQTLGTYRVRAGRVDDALAAFAEAVEVHRDLAAADPSRLLDLADALTVLGAHLDAAGRGDEAPAAWDAALDAVDPRSGAVLLGCRSRDTGAGTVAAASWLVDALGRGGDTVAIVVGVRDEARRHHAADPDGWSAAWVAAGGEPAPAWLTVDRDVLAAARAWVATDTYTDEHRVLAEHPELLGDAAGPAVDEALLGADPQEAERLRAVRGSAVEYGIDGVYRPILIAVLAGAFARAEPAAQRALVAERRDDLVAATETVVEWASGEGATLEVVRAATLLQLLGDDPSDGMLDELFAALAEPSRFTGLLQATARSDAPAQSLGHVASLGYSATSEHADAAVAAVFAALAMAEDGHGEQARSLLDHAAGLAPDDRDAWVRSLLTVRARRPSAVELADHLLNPDG